MSDWLSPNPPDIAITLEVIKLKQEQMSVYKCQEQNWEIIEEFWNNEFPEKFKDQTVFQMEPFPKCLLT